MYHTPNYPTETLRQYSTLAANMTLTIKVDSLFRHPCFSLVVPIFQPVYTITFSHNIAQVPLYCGIFPDFPSFFMILEGLKSTGQVF